MNLRDQSNDLRIACIHLLSTINSASSNQIEDFVVLYISSCISTILEIISIILITSNTCRYILLNPKVEEENFDLRKAFQNMVDKKTSKNLFELDEITKTTQKSIWEEPTSSIIYTKETKQLEKKKVRAASLNNLVIEITNENNYDRHFMKTFLATYRSFSTPAQLLTKLMERFNVPSSFKENISSQIKLRVGIVTKYWVENQFFDFDTQVLSTLTNFVKEKFLKNKNLNQGNFLILFSYFVIFVLLFYFYFVIFILLFLFYFYFVIFILFYFYFLIFIFLFLFSYFIFLFYFILFLFSSCPTSSQRN